MINRTKAALLGMLLFALIPAFAVVEVDEEGMEAPEFNARTWINSPPLTLVENPGFGEHVLELEISQPGVSLYSFTFGGNCESAFEHR